MSGNSLYEHISRTFNKNELRSLCFDPGIDSEELLDEWRFNPYKEHHIPQIITIT